jgi:hypothetical protein
MATKSKMVRTTRVGRDVLAFAFWRDATGNPVARTEFQSLQAYSGTAAAKVLAHFASVHAVKSIQHNAALAKAQCEPGTPQQPDLFWWDYHGVGAFYTYDGQDLLVILAGRVSNSSSYGSYLATAKGRV